MLADVQKQGAVQEQTHPLNWQTCSSPVTETAQTGEEEREAPCSGNAMKRERGVRGEGKEEYKERHGSESPDVASC